MGRPDYMDKVIDASKKGPLPVASNPKAVAKNQAMLAKLNAKQPTTEAVTGPTLAQVRNRAQALRSATQTRMGVQTALEKEFPGANPALFRQAMQDIGEALTENADIPLEADIKNARVFPDQRSATREALLWQHMGADVVRAPGGFAVQLGHRHGNMYIGKDIEEHIMLKKSDLPRLVKEARLNIKFEQLVEALTEPKTFSSHEAAASWAAKNLHGHASWRVEARASGYVIDLLPGGDRSGRKHYVGQDGQPTTEAKDAEPGDSAPVVPGTAFPWGNRTLSPDQLKQLSTKEAAYTPFTGQPCTCKPGVQRDNCPHCEGTGKRIDFAAIHAARKAAPVKKEAAGSGFRCQECGRKVPAGRTSCPKCGSEDLDVAEAVGPEWRHGAAPGTPPLGQYGEPVKEVAPKGWEGTVKAMKKDKDIDNPWALAHWMKGKGMQSHKKEGTTMGEQLNRLRRFIREEVEKAVREAKTDPTQYMKTPQKAGMVKKVSEAGGIANFKGKQAKPFSGKKSVKEADYKPKGEPGTGERFKQLTKSLAAKEGVVTEEPVRNPKALAAWIGRKKYGKEKFQQMAAAGKK